MKHIILTFYDLGLGGVQTKLITLANALAHEGNQVTLALARLEKTKGFDRTVLLDSRVKVIACPGEKWLPARWYYYWLLFLCLWKKPDAIVLSLEETSVRFLALRETFRNYLPDATKIFVNMDIDLRWVQQNTQQRLHHLLNQATKVIAVSKPIYTDLLERIKIEPDRLVYIPNWSTIAPRANTKFRKYDLVFMGRLETQKQPLRCLFYLKRKRKNNPKVKLHFFASGSLQPLLKKTIKQHGLTSAVEWHSPTTEVAEVLSQTKVLILPSLFEGCPQVALEALRCGCTLVVSQAVRESLPPASAVVNAQANFLKVLKS